MSENTENAQPNADASRVPLDCIVVGLYKYPNFRGAGYASMYYIESVSGFMGLARVGDAGWYAQDDWGGKVVAYHGEIILLCDFAEILRQRNEAREWAETERSKYCHPDHGGHLFPWESIASFANSGVRCHSDERINRQHIQTNTDQ